MKKVDEKSLPVVRVCQNEIMDEKTLPVVPSSWEEGLGVVEKLPSSLPPRASPPLTPPSRRRGLQIDSLLYFDTPSKGW